MVVNLYEAATNWFLTWDEEAADEGKSLLLQVKVANLAVRDLLGDGVNSYVTVCRQRNGPDSGWEVVGKTAVIKDEVDPEYPEGFRIFYEQETDLSQDLLKVLCYHKREGIGQDEMIGTACISMRELVRAFGARVRVELMKEKKGKVVGNVCFLAEALPNRSPRGGGNVFEFKISTRLTRKSEVKFQGARMFLVVSREREDKTWGIVYRSAVVKRHPVVNMLQRGVPIVFKAFTIRQAELVLGGTPRRRVKFSLCRGGKNGGIVGEVETCVDELLNEFEEDTGLDVTVGGNVVGEFVNVGRYGGGVRGFEIEVNYFDAESEARAIVERRKRKVLNLDSP